MRIMHVCWIEAVWWWYRQIPTQSWEVTIQRIPWWYAHKGFIWLSNCSSTPVSFPRRRMVPCDSVLTSKTSTKSLKGSVPDPTHNKPSWQLSSTRSTPSSTSMLASTISCCSWHEWRQPSKHLWLLWVPVMPWDSPMHHYHSKPLWTTSSKTWLISS